MVPGPTKDNFLKGGYLDYRLQKNIIEVIDTSYSGREGVREIMREGSRQARERAGFSRRRSSSRSSSGEVNKPNGLAVYGLPRIIDALNRSNMDIDPDLRRHQHHQDSDDLQELPDREGEGRREPEEDADHAGDAHRSPARSAVPPTTRWTKSDVVDMLEEKAIQIGAKVEMISSGTEEGVMLKSFGGAAGFLRYRM